MQAFYLSHKTRIAAAGISLPLGIFALLRLVPAWDYSAWSTIWYTHLVYFYVMAFISFIALVTGLFSNAAFRVPLTSRTFFIRLALITIAAFSLLNSVNTPYIFFPEIGDYPLQWSIRIGGLLSAIFFAAATIHWPAIWEKRLLTYRWFIWGGGGLLLALFIGVIWSYPNLLAALNKGDSLINLTSFGIAAPALLWSARHSLRLFQNTGQMIEGALATALALLFAAQISQTFGLWGHFSWQLYSFTTLAALSVILSAFLRAFQSLRDLQPARYFAVRGSIFIVGLALVGGELARWLTTGIQRRFIVSLTLAQGVIGFIIMYAIVLGLNRLVDERTAALKQEQKLRNDLTQLIVHDLKNPLMIMTEGAKLLDRGFLGDLTEQQKGLVQRMGQSGHKTLQLIDDLLDVERLEAEAIELQIGPMDLWSILSESAAHFRVLADANKQSLSLRLTTQLPVIQADAKLMRRVFDNVIGNALKFSPENGRIEISARKETGQVVIAIDDSGPGISTAYRVLIFEKFGQLPSNERRGVGLGLTFCKMTVEAHQGAITVGDSHLGGALFEVRLPVAETMVDKQRDIQFREHPSRPPASISPWQPSQL